MSRVPEEYKPDDPNRPWEIKTPGSRTPEPGSPGYIEYVRTELQRRVSLRRIRKGLEEEDTSRTGPKADPSRAGNGASGSFLKD
ncbi:MAG: hypothetical protein JSW08_02910 [archaeon]|nr:MAG: hypothetical protein JSW08_02910 [archaeon]